mgnify:CR=1 FL=1
MHQMFTYNRVKEWLLGESYAWDRVFDIFEKVVNVPDIIIAYPKSLYRNNLENINIYFFSKGHIYSIYSSTNGKDYEINDINPRNICKIKLNISGNDNVVLAIAINNEEILLSSKEDANQMQSYKYAETLLEIAKIYTT